MAHAIFNVSPVRFLSSFQDNVHTMTNSILNKISNNDTKEPEYKKKNETPTNHVLSPVTLQLTLPVEQQSTPINIPRSTHNDYHNMNSSPDDLTLNFNGLTVHSPSNSYYLSQQSLVDNMQYPLYNQSHPSSSFLTTNHLGDQPSSLFLTTNQLDTCSFLATHPTESQQSTSFLIPSPVGSQQSASFLATHSVGSQQSASFPTTSPVGSQQSTSFLTTSPIGSQQSTSFLTTDQLMNDTQPSSFLTSNPLCSPPQSSSFLTTDQLGSPQTTSFLNTNTIQQSPQASSFSSTIGNPQSPTFLASCNDDNPQSPPFFNASHVGSPQSVQFLNTSQLKSPQSPSFLDTAFLNSPSSASFLDTAFLNSPQSTSFFDTTCIPQSSSSPSYLNPAQFSPQPPSLLNTHHHSPQSPSFLNTQQYLQTKSTAASPNPTYLLNSSGALVPQEDPSLALISPCLLPVQDKPKKSFVKKTTPSGRKAKIHICPYCCHSSNRANNMKEHILIHDPNRPKPYLCKLCRRPFARKHDMTRHYLSCKKLKHKSK